MVARPLTVDALPRTATVSPRRPAPRKARSVVQAVPAARAVVAVDPTQRRSALTARIDGLTAEGKRPVVLLCSDTATSLQPATRPDATFVDMTGTSDGVGDNVTAISSPAFVEMGLTRVLQAVRNGGNHVIVDDMAMMAFYCGGGPTRAFAHSLAAGLMLADVGCDLFVTDGPDAGPLMQALGAMLG